VVKISLWLKIMQNYNFYLVFSNYIQRNSQNTFIFPQKCLPLHLITGHLASVEAPSEIFVGKTITALAVILENIET
jgi:hypothetical protein